jgi:nitrogen regulatory protein A
MEQLSDLKPVVDTCGQLMKELGCDFVGLAIQNEIGPDVRWHYAAGNANDKYEKITVRFGKGIAGKVISTGSPILIEDFPNNIHGKAIEYPIMLAEKLIAAYAVPLFFETVAKGVLFVGNRGKHLFSETERQRVKRSAHLLEEILKGRITS